MELDGCDEQVVVSYMERVCVTVRGKVGIGGMGEAVVSVQVK